ncbi:NYN domain-containing protein [Salinicoccus sp. RF5]|uniref:NYN domain-containing protein n=1 Tax=Salinicoccus sp. RF5 TaxID=2748874 RepID=UPI001E622DFC|nr:NYN domain-containing protein [Salinicoccus sp. RF5]MCC4722810.1 NYN domain-containing protein [Salinicoccus sp. RF5]
MKRKKRRILIVDGYNLIGADQELHRESLHSLEMPREKILAALAEYQSVANYEIICVFDAYEVRSKESILDYHGVTVVYTKEKETADEYIERFVHDHYHPHLCEISVVTSDLTEQNAIFALGAYRISSREMWVSLAEAEKNISRKIDTINEKMPRQKLDIRDDVQAKLEKWRRGRF